ncbi:DUF485 domain-containing protein [Zavarzinia sp.]|uniref:DUF485 domain-containing protein n=1 Tax=Zavarzinia sp. TaxID=2027920 RepID=UPI00356455EA
MLHAPAAPQGKDYGTDYKSRIGARMFLVYALIYAGFVAINVIAPLAMEGTVFLGLNLAVVYGMGLIVFALILALVYTRLCTLKEKELSAIDAKKEH